MSNSNSTNNGTSIAVVAGELSGEMHAAGVVAELKSRGVVDVFGMGGTHLRALGVDTIVDSESDAGGVMGFLNVLGKLPQIFRSLKTLENELKTRKPAAILLVDYPGFNLKLAPVAEKLGIPVYYFIIPKMWIWKSSRVEKFKKFITQSFTIFPFENAWLKAHGFERDTFVGHPIADQLAARPIDRDRIRAELGVANDDKLLAVLPGSRGHELNRHIPIIIEAVIELRKSVPKLRIVAPVAPTQRAHPMWKLADKAGITRTDINSLDVMRAADIGLIKSGTSTLEAAACGLPSIMIYKTSAISAFIVRRFIRAADFSLPNIIRNGTMLELTQEQATPQRISHELRDLLRSERADLERKRYQEMLSTLTPTSLSESEGRTPYERVAEIILSSISP